MSEHESNTPNAAAQAEASAALPSAPSEDKATPARRVGIVKRVSLEGMSDGWGADCFVLVQGVGYDEFKRFKNLDTSKIDEEAGLDLMVDFIKQHFVNGFIMYIGEDGELFRDRVEAADVNALDMSMIHKIFMEMTGQQYDPLDMRKVLAEASKQSTGTEPSTTSSSEAETPSNSQPSQ